MKRSISIRPYIAVIMIVVAVFVVSNFLLVRAIRNYFLKSLETEYVNYASIYSHGLTKTAEAYRIINDMLERRIISSNRTIALNPDHITNESLVALADTLAVDEIYLYNPQGEIIFSTRDAYLGWQALPGHPVHDFMISGAKSLVEDIRRDTESEDYYKYGYFRLDDGRFLQLGVRADLVEDFQAPFEVQKLIEEINGLGILDYVLFVDENYTVTASSRPSYIGRQMEDARIRSAIKDQVTHAVLVQARDGSGEIYNISVPVFEGDRFLGTLLIGESTEGTEAIVRIATTLGIVLTTVAFGGFVYVMVSNFRTNKLLAALAYEDSLTGLPNKAFLEELLTEELANPTRGKKAVVMIHCRNLGEINSTYGFDVGDRVMQIQAGRLQQFARDYGQLFRFAGNRFVLYVSTYRDRDELSALVEQVRASLEQSIDFVTKRISTRIGVVELSESHSGAAEVLAQASLTIHYLESGNSNGSYAFFDAHVEKSIHRQETIAVEMEEFLSGGKTGTFFLQYQPKVSLTSNQIVGFEALSRMNSPTLGMVSPGEFIPIAERQEMIIPLGYWGLETACQFIKLLADKGHGDLYVAVNISVIQLLQDDFPEKVKEIVERAGVRAEKLQLEITESVFIEDFGDIQAKLCPLRDLGVTIALDDFGTGYSALSRIEELPIDYIKIDKSFIDNIMVKDEQRQIIQELITMCHKLGLKVVAEGVEHEAQREYLAESGCDIMQGYLFSKPLVEEAALEKLKSG
ncbi:MAG: phosphodiesterase [Firmicutes bacterium]|nr:phosphodiesterase [Bacillota bacterium]